MSDQKPLETSSPYVTVFAEQPAEQSRPRGTFSQPNAMKPAFRSSNLAVAAYFVATKLLKLSKIEIDGQHAMFVFEDEAQKGDRLETDFLTHDALVPGAEFHRQLRILRRMIQDKQDCKQRNTTAQRQGSYANESHQS